ncbi:hypothetical protein BBBOND_0201160 [Babesia bigemina]|uniref:Uncharacterized protein n=1 Tax=Babesia bigemina TaxID=5866 RepID=A0A061D7S6_BABBI|nr:hypothetical protein BBBOND_0201160 [Babesia bigemina]CDR94959.1 hypothetical protein BBBOND_0201160 [Babesia bigemina]|eukprot:XP_012767145.1 hypothetical protein BBBOND_0201160 [Babesia bigemina]
MAYNSLTQAPRNLKEGIDWLIALKGDDFQYHMEEMGAAVYDLLEDKPVGFTEVPALEEVKRISKEFMEQEALKDEWSVKRLLGRFSKRMSKTGLFARRGKNDAKSEFENIVQTQQMDPDAIASNIGRVVYDSEQFLNKIKAPGKYKSAYTSEATWEKSCSEKPEDCAAVLVGIMPMLYVGLRSLFDATALSVWESLNANAEKHMSDVLNAAGFREPECQANMSIADVVKAFKSVDLDIFIILYDLAGFWAFY